MALSACASTATSSAGDSGTPPADSHAAGTGVAPIYWQRGYEKNWQTFVAAFVQHYSYDQNIGYIHVGLGTGAQTLIVGTRNTLCLDKWNSVGYQTSWPAYVQQMISLLVLLHSSTQPMVSFNDYANEPPADEIARWDAAGGIGFGFGGLQASDATVYASGQPCGQNRTNWCALFNQYAGKMPMFVQTYPGPEVGTSLAPTLQQAQPTGPLTPVLRTAMGVHTQIFEIYAPDSLIACDRDQPGYAHDHASYANAFAEAAAVVGTALSG